MVQKYTSLNDCQKKILKNISNQKKSYIFAKLKIIKDMSKANITKSLCVLALLFFASFGAKAQLSHLVQSVYMNANFPSINFNDRMTTMTVPMNKDFIGTEAITGVGLGYRISYRFDIGFGEVSPYVHADFNWNSIRGDLRDMYIDSSCSAPAYFNIPVYVGVNYRYQMTEIFTPFAEFGIGYDLMLVTKEGGSTTVAPTLKYQTSGAMGWQIGAGSFFGQHVSAGLHFSGYGKHVMEYNNNTANDLQAWDAANGTSLYDTSKPKRRIGVFSIRIGFHF